jgi:hypothetical protein
MNTLIDANLEEPYFRTWRQGDVILNPGDIRLVFQADLNDPATATTRAAAAGGDAQGIEVIEADVPGFAVLTQSCDLAQAPARRPFVILAALGACLNNRRISLGDEMRVGFCFCP